MSAFLRYPRAAAALAVALLAASAIAALSMLGSRPSSEPVASHAPQSEPSGSSEASEGAPFRYDIEYPFIRYSTAERTDRVAEVERRLASGELQLERKPPRGPLDALLAALDVDPASQVLVFSATSLQVGSIRPRTPRAIYFNDDVYVAWVQGGGPIEIASMDPVLGPVFYTLRQADEAVFERQTDRCLRCHDSYSLSGGGVPRFIVGSGYIGTRGNIVTHEGWILTSQRTPLRSRWGGWYVTGRHGDQVHLGNIVVRDVADLADLESLRTGNLESLDGLVNTAPYAAAGSDIVALLVLQHQIDVQNQIARLSYAVRSALHAAGSVTPSLETEIKALAEPLVEALLFVGEAPLTAPVSGDSPFRSQFERRGPFDGAGRSLRQLDLERRLMRYPLSYLVYSKAFDALPAIAKDQVHRRLAEVLTGRDRDEKLANLSAADRAAALEILTATKPDFSAALDRPALGERATLPTQTLSTEPLPTQPLRPDAPAARP